MIIEVEISPSDRAKCRGGNRIIGKGEPREIEAFYQNSHITKYYYSKCSEERDNCWNDEEWQTKSNNR